MWRAVLCLSMTAACTPDWSPASVVNSLRVIGVRADPPEIRPGETARLQQLIIEPDGMKTTTLWLGCDPDPFNEGRGACSDVTALSDASSLVNTASLPPGVKLIGYNDQAAYSVDPTLFDVLAADDPRRVTGTVGVLVSIAVDEEISPAASQEELAAVAARVRSGEDESQLTLFRVAVSESPNPNHNPIADQLTVNAPVATGATALVEPGVGNRLDLTAHDLEPYDEQTPMGVQHLIEHITAAWYTTSGRFSEDRVTLFSDVKSVMTGPGGTDADDPIPPNNRGTLWGVLRDSRGGQSWASWPFWVCDPALPLPTISGIETDGGFVVRGTHLDQLVDVIVEGAAVSGDFRSTTGTWEGTPPALDAGQYTADLTSKNCIHQSTTFTLK